MTDLPPDPIDPYEARLAARIRAHADHATAPIDATSIAHKAAAGQRDGRRIRLVRNGNPGAVRLAGVAAVLVAVVAIGSLGLRGGVGGPPPGPSSPGNPPASGSVADATPTPASSPTPDIASSPEPSPVSTPAEPTPTPSTPAPQVAACDPATLTARITQWTGAAGHRIAEVELRNDGGTCSLLVKQQLVLVDGGGRALIEGATARTQKTITLAPGDTVTTMVDDANYCGPAPVAPVTIVFVVPDGGRIVAAPPATPGPGGVPPCNGPTEPASIQMHAWKP
jgi:hypothetical protein